MSARKVRTWKCACCGASWMRRKAAQHPPRCVVCAKRMVAGRTYSDVRQCRHRKQIGRYGKWREKYASVPRTRAGRVLNPPAEVRRAWSEVRKAKTRPAIERRTRKFIALLFEHSRTRPHPDFYAKIMKPDGKTTSHWGGRTGVPDITLTGAPPRGNLLGDYRANLLKGTYGIRVWDRGRTLDDIRETLVHEILHALDHDASMPDGGHDHLWRKRLARMEQLFPPHQFGTSVPKR